MYNVLKPIIFNQFFNLKIKSQTNKWNILLSCPCTKLGAVYKPKNRKRKKTVERRVLALPPKLHPDILV